ncbi:50S ribosomal protein L4, partial [Sulfuricurvum sp. RIFOXYD12_FULL_44_77]
MSAIVLNEKFEKASELALPESFSGINTHNLYLYVKSYQASIRSNTASAKTRSEMRGGGKKPWAQKGKGGARAGSRRSPIFVGGAVAHGPNTGRNYDQKINKKQKKLALKCALDALATAGKLFIVDSIEVPTGKTKDALALFNALNVRDALL